MYLEWTQHLKTPEEKEKFEKEVRAARHVLDRLKDILEQKEKALDRSETTIEVYNTPEWSHRQAHKNGNREVLVHLKKLIDLDQQKRNTK